MSALERFARRLREETGFSRNRRFDELSLPEARDLRRRLRRLDGIARELRVAEGIALHRDGDGFRLELRFPAVRARRLTHLTRDEHAILVGQGHLAESPRASGAA